jgi:hypothetical protein
VSRSSENGPSIDTAGASAVLKLTMMVHCGKCGVELMGAVNRCWKCGQPVVSRADSGSAPPVRRPPVAGALDIVDDDPVAETVEDNQAVDGQPADPGAPAKRAPRRSPFAPGAKLNKNAAPKEPRHTARAAHQLGGDASAPKETPRPVSPLARVSALVAICLGAGAFALSDYPEVAFAFALVGLGFGIAAVISRVQVTSVAGVVLCFAAFLWTGYSMAVVIYERAYGISPWASQDDDFDPTPQDSDDDKLQP